MWDNPCAFTDQVDLSNHQTTSLGKVKLTGKHFSWYCSDDLRAIIEQPSCLQYKPGDLLAVRTQYWDVIIDEYENDENWADAAASSGGRSRSSDDNGNADSKGKEDMQGGEKRTGKGMCTKDGKGSGRGKATEKGKGKGKGNDTGNGIDKQTLEAADIPRAVAVQLQKEMYDTDLDTEG